MGKKEPVSQSVSQAKVQVAQGGCPFPLPCLALPCRPDSMDRYSYPYSYPYSYIDVFKVSYNDKESCCTSTSKRGSEQHRKPTASSSLRVEVEGRGGLTAALRVDLALPRKKRQKKQKSSERTGKRGGESNVHTVK